MIGQLTMCKVTKKQMRNVFGRFKTSMQKRSKFRKQKQKKTLQFIKFLIFESSGSSECNFLTCFH